MNGLTKQLGISGALALAMVGMIVTTAAAAPPPVTCGQVLTQDTQLSADVGPCSGNGLVIGANDVKLNLNGHTVSAANGPEETIGILFDGVRHSTVTKGSVTGFDAGINIDGGGHNQVTHIAAHDNINDNIPDCADTTPPNTQPCTTSPDDACTYGDGITTTNSFSNKIARNDVVHNGPFSGISLVEDSDTNQVRSNRVADNNVPNVKLGGATGSCGSPFSRRVQDIGIRVEGPGDDGNVVSDNDVTNSAIGGITIHGFVYCPPTPTPGQCGPAQAQNTDNVIRGNRVTDTGRDTRQDDPLADGIAVLRQGPSTVVGVSQGNKIVGNRVNRSIRNGIFLGDPRCGFVGPTPPAGQPDTRPIRCQPGPYTGTLVKGNTITNSVDDGIRVPGPPPVVPGSRDPGSPGSINNRLIRNTARNNGDNLAAALLGQEPTGFGHDGHDDNVSCDSNLWSMNDFEFVNQRCVDPSAAIR